jgi:hypothetical protein
MSGLELAGVDKLSTIAALVKRLTLSRGVLRFAISLFTEESHGTSSMDTV